MSDVVESGRPERSPRGWAVGGLAVLLVAGAAYGATRPAPERARGRAAPTPSSSPTPPYGSVPDPVVTPDAGSDEPTESPPFLEEDPDRGDWSLPPLKARTGLRVAGPGHAFTTFRLDDGRVTRTPFRLVAAVDPVAAIPGGWLAFQRPCDTFYCADEALYAIDDRGEVRLVGKGEDAVLAEDGRSVWLTGHTSTTKSAEENPRWLERRTFDGKRVGPRRTLRAGESVVGAGGGGLVVADAYGIGEPVTLLDPATGSRRVLVKRGNPVAVSRSHVAWTSDGCQYEPIHECTLHLTPLASGRSVTLGTLPVPVARAELDPAGRYLAVAFDHVLFEGPPRVGAPSAVVYDTRTRREVRLRGLTFPPSVHDIAWSPDGWLLLTRQRHAETGPWPHVLALWRPGMAGPVEVGDYPGAGQGSFVLRSG